MSRKETVFDYRTIEFRPEDRLYREARVGELRAFVDKLNELSVPDSIPLHLSGAGNGYLEVRLVVAPGGQLDFPASLGLR